MRVSSLALVKFFVLLVALGGCTGSDPANVIDTSDADDGFVPLAIGHSWTYDATRTLTITFLDGSTSPPPDVSTVSETRTMTQHESVFGRDYIVEERTFASPRGAVTLWRRLRQDADGLYAAAVPEDTPPEARVGGAPNPAVDEDAVRLQYPLEAGAQWIVRSQPLVERAIVEGIETLSVPAGDMEAYRIRIENGTLGPNDSAHWWYGDCGLVRTRVRREIMAMDPGTGEASRIVTEIIEELVAFEPVGNRVCPAENR
jgi:hypothetical protein